MSKLCIISAALMLTACQGPAQRQGRVYSNLEPKSDFIPLGNFANEMKCQEAGRKLVDHMKLGRNGEASRRYANGKVVCTRS